MNNHIVKTLKSPWWISDSLSFYLAFISMILMPLYHWYLTPFMILWGVFFFIGFRRKIGNIMSVSSGRKLLFIFFILFFLWQVLGMFYSDDLKDGVRNITLRLPLLLFPLVLISPEEKIRQNPGILLHVFSLSTFTFFLICFGNAIFRSIEIQNEVLTFNPHPQDYPWLNYFYGSEFAIFQHPSYLSMYALLAVCIAFETFLRKSLSIKYRMIWLVISLVLLVSIYLLSSRAAILATIILIPVYFIIKLLAGDLRKVGWIGIILGTALILVILISNPRLHSFVQNGTKQELIDKTMKESRISIWKAAFRLIKSDIIFGVGTGDIQDKLNEEYFRMGNSDLIKVKNLNAHNQFIEVTAENGIIGLALLLAIFVVMSVIAISEKNTIYLIFIIIVFISFLFETMLNRLAGLSFFAIFSFLLLHVKYSENK